MYNLPLRYKLSCTADWFKHFSFSSFVEGLVIFLLDGSDKTFFGTLVVSSELGLGVCCESMSMVKEE